MTLVISTCADPLSEREFVDPIVSIVGECEVQHYSTTTGPGDHERVILCGTALQDDQVIDDIEQLAWLRDTDRAVLGVCAGTQVLVALFGGKVTPGVGSEIGMKKVRTLVENPLSSGTFEAFCMHLSGIDPPPVFETLAESDTSPQIIHHRERNLWGVLFHPEVRNGEIVQRFLNLPGAVPKS